LKIKKIGQSAAKNLKYILTIRQEYDIIMVKVQRLEQKLVHSSEWKWCTLNR